VTIHYIEIERTWTGESRHGHPESFIIFPYQQAGNIFQQISNRLKNEFTT
jgi:hypothetical protein